MNDKIYISVPFEQKDLAKSYGARWDSEAKSWFFYRNNDIIKALKWFPKQSEYKVIDLKDYEIVQRYKLIECRFSTAIEIIKRFRINIDKLQLGGGFCAMCDSDFSGWYFNANQCLIELRHTWDNDCLNPKEEFMLEQYLEEYFEKKGNGNAFL